MTSSRPVAPVLIAGVALLGGCAQLDWHKLDTTAKVRERDIADCTAQARSEARQHVTLVQPPGQRIIADNQGRATLVQPSNCLDDRFLVEQDFMRICMYQRGYVLQNVLQNRPIVDSKS